MDMNLSRLGEKVKDRKVWDDVVHGSQRVRHDLATEQKTTKNTITWGIKMLTCKFFLQGVGYKHLDHSS